MRGLLRRPDPVVGADALVAAVGFLLLAGLKKRATMQGSAEEKRCRSLVLKKSKKFDCNDAKNCARIQGFADRSESEVKKKFSASILKNIQPIS
ncbi:hypothetical protein, partial [Delftia sp. ASV31]|uniref:hypothetical protein n=1 Tax=Delftia sp. ASV31 TaxID=2795113 RepID=UPI001E549F8D